MPSPFRDSPHLYNRPAASHASSHRFNKACDSCHISKVRCMPDASSPVSTCKRCSKNGTPCIFSPVGPRRRPTRTKIDRIAELERRVKDMQIKLEKQVDRRAVIQPDASNPVPASSGEASASQSTSASRMGSRLNAGSSDKSSSARVTTGKGSSTNITDGAKSAPRIWAVEGSRQSHKKVPALDATESTSFSPTSAPKARPAESGYDNDIIEKGLVTKHEADQLIYEFRTVLNGKYLGICLPKATSNSQLRQSRPAFWLSILCAASAGSPKFHHLAPVLFSELKEILDARIIPGGEPDLDALQALMSWAIFHNDPVFPLGEHVVEIYALAVQMSIDMAEQSKLHRLPADTPIQDDDVSEYDIQLSRELLHWYWASFSIAFKRRKHFMIRQTHLVDASLRILQIAPNQSDARLVQWIKLVQIAADAVLALHQGHTQEADGLSEKARDEILDLFERKRKQWLVDCPFNLVNGEFLAAKCTRDPRRSC